MFEGLRRQPEQNPVGKDAAIGVQFPQHLFVTLGVAKDSHTFKVFGRRTQHRWAPNIDILHRLFQRDVLFLGDALKRIEVHDHHVDQADTVLGELLHMFFFFAQRQKPAVDLRVQRFNTPVEHLRESGIIRHLLDRDSAFP